MRNPLCLRNPEVGKTRFYAVGAAMLESAVAASFWRVRYLRGLEIIVPCGTNLPLIGYFAARMSSAVLAEKMYISAAKNPTTPPPYAQLWSVPTSLNDSLSTTFLGM